MAPSLEVVVGTYEQFLLGYTVDDVVNKYKMEQSFATHSHLASIRSVASNKHYLASSAADDTVCLYDMRNRSENGKLVHHSDTVNSIAFTPDASHIITASSDGTIGIVRCGNWQVEKHWLKPHKGLAVDTLAIHPTGKIAMTTGHDGVLRTWNLVKGRQAYATNLVPRWKLDAKNVSALKWSPSGESYLIAANNRIDIYSIETAGIEEEISFDSKVASVEYLGDEFIAVGLTDGKIVIYDLEKSSIVNEIQAHKIRVKCLAREGELLVSASSSGEIKLWLFEKDKLTLLNEINCSARISCLTVSTCASLKNKKEEVDLEEKVIEKPSNKMRLKQQVIIEEEDNEEKTTRLSKKKRDKKKARKLIEEAQAEIQNASKIRKVEMNASEGSLSKKRESDSFDPQLDQPKKKKKSINVNKKRKSMSDEVVEVKELPQKKKKENVSTKVEFNNNKMTEKKKRKIPITSTIESPPKKSKAELNKTKKSVIKKKRIKKDFKKKISR